MRLTRRERDAVRAAAQELGWTPCEFRFAVAFSDRLVGMIGSSAPCRTHGWPHFETPAVYVFPRCCSIHTCFMACAIDVAFISHAGEILALHEAVLPWKVLSCPGAWAALERVSLARVPRGRVGEPSKLTGRARLSMEMRSVHAFGVAGAVCPQPVGLPHGLGHISARLLLSKGASGALLSRTGRPGPRRRDSRTQRDMFR